MDSLAYINNNFINFKNAKVNIEDRGLQFGDSVYEVIAFANGNFIDLKFHLKRLKYSLGEINISYKINENKLLKIFQKLINHNNILKGIIYLQITRGVQSREHAYRDNLKPTLIVYTKKKNFNLPGKNFKGVKVITHEDLRWGRADIKTVNLLPNILAEKIAHKKKAYTAILIKNNRITEGCSSNIWIVKNKTIYTHPSNKDILKGITRQRLKIIMKENNLFLKENSFTLRQLYNADEVFLTSSGSLVTPVIKIDNNSINNNKIGKITLKLSQLYSKSFFNE